MRPLDRHFLSFTAVLLQCLDAERNPIRDATATGFIRSEGGKLFLYTCWHVVTGFDPDDVRVGLSLPNRKYLRLLMQGADKSDPAVTVIGKCCTQDIPLYDSSASPATPLWSQEFNERSHPDLNAIGLHVPAKQDVVKLELSLNFDYSNLQVLRDDQTYNFSMPLITPGEKAYIVGYPYGYSSLGSNQPTPIVLTRFIAAAEFLTPHGPTLLESIGAPGMSGAPVFIERGSEILLFGIYTGLIYPDYERGSNEKTTALGKVQNLLLAFSGDWPLAHHAAEG